MCIAYMYIRVPDVCVHNTGRCVYVQYVYNVERVEIYRVAGDDVDVHDVDDDDD